MHLDIDIYAEKERLEVAKKIGESDVEYAVDIGFDLNSSAMAVRHSEEYPWCYAAVGFHPHEVKNMDEDSLELIKGLSKKPKVVAIGEIGLDYYRNLSSEEDQIHWFIEQTKLALELDMPIIIHDRDAHGEVLRILKEEGVFSEERKSKFPVNPITGTVDDARLLMHCYSGSAELAEQYVKLGATLSVAGPVTYKNNRKTGEVVDAIPLAHLLIETDAPYLTPEPFRGKSNISPYVEFTARKIAAIKGISYEEVAETTLANAKRFFGIDQ